MTPSPPPVASPFLKESDLVQRWQLPSGTLRKWRSQGVGPKFIKLEGSVRYRIDDVLRYEQLTYPASGSQ